MMATEFGPCGSLADCIKKRSELAETVKARHLACVPAVADATAAKGLTTSVALSDRHLRRRRRVVAGRRVSLCLTTTPTTLEGRPNMLLDEGADVAPVVKVTTALALPSTCRL